MWPLCFPGMCVCDKQKERGREEREGDQILLQVFHKQHNSANRSPSLSFLSLSLPAALGSLLCSFRFLLQYWWIRLMALTHTLD